MRRTLLVAVAAVGLIGWVDPKTAGPTVSDDAVKAEAERQAVYMYKARWKEAQRVDDITFRLEVANQDLCADRSARLGLTLGSAEDVDKRWRAAATEALRLGEGVSVLHVAARSPADSAGLRPGDVIVSLNGAAAPSGRTAQAQLEKRLREILDKAPAAPVTFGVRRDGQVLTLPATPVMACSYGAVVEETDVLNASADGANIHINRPILRMADTDEELALVIAHELAHNGQQHRRAQMHNARIVGFGGLLLDGVAAAYGVNTQGRFTKAGMQIGAEHASVAFESEADYVGMYYMARAGYSTAGVEDFWRKFAVEAPDSIFVKTDHPVTPERFLAIAAASQEIEAKRARGEPLVPNQKKD